MRKKILIICGAIAAVIALVIGIFAIRQNIEHDRDDSDMIRKNDITYIYYIKGGGMRGGSCEIRAKLNEETGLVEIESTNIEYYGAEEVHKEISTDRQILTDIGAVVDKGNLKAASHLPKSRIQVLDGDSYDLIIDYRSGKEVRIDSNKMLTNKHRQAINEIVEMLLNAD